MHAILRIFNRHIFIIIIVYRNAFAYHGRLLNTYACQERAESGFLGNFANEYNKESGSMITITGSIDCRIIFLPVTPI